MKIERNSVLSSGREQVFRNFIGPLGLRGGGTANPLLQPLGPLCQTLPKLMHKLLTATEIIKASVFPTVAVGLCPSQLPFRPQHSGPDEPDAPLSCIQLLPLFTSIVSSSLRASILLNYQCWHCWITFGGPSRTRRRGEMVTQKVDLSVFFRVPVLSLLPTHVPFSTSVKIKLMRSSWKVSC